MLKSLSRVLRTCIALAVLGSCLVLGTAGTAAASTTEPPTTSWTESFPIKFGNTGVEVGSGTVSRVDGVTEDTIVVEFTVPGGYQESHLCTASTPFTSKVSPGQCQYQQLGAGADSGSYTITVGATEVVYLQLHITTQGETAYLGWVHGHPAYGNVEVPNVLTCPTGYDEPAGEMVDGDGDGVADNCVFVPVSAECPEGMVEGEGVPAMDTDGDGEADNCVEPAGEPTCPTGYDEPVGEMVDADDDGVADNCVFVPVSAECPEGMVEGEGVPAMDTDGDGVADNCVEPVVTTECPEGQLLVDGECRTPVIPTVPVVVPDTCPDGSVMADVNGDGVADAQDCTVVLPDPGVEPTTPTPAIPAQPGTPGEPATPAVPAAPAPSVLPSTATPTVVPVAAPAPVQADNAVLGAQVTRAPLARTGSSSTGLAAFGALLLLLGVAATTAGRRTARA